MRQTLLSALFFMFFSTALLAQYDFSTFTQTYAPLTGATAVDLGVDEFWDDPEFELVPGFDFALGNSSYSTLYQIDLGAVLGVYVDDLPVGFGYLTDVMNGANVEGAEESTITYSITGNTGNRILKLQYANCAFYEEIIEEETANNRTNFQIWLFESDHSFEIHFGSSTITDPILVYEGYSGPRIGTLDDVNGQFFLLTGDPSNPTFAMVDINTVDFSLSGTPESGRVYRFTPSAPVSTINPSNAAFSVYPTLANDVINVKGVNGKANYRIFDLTGKEVAAGILNNNGILSVNTLNAGVYLFSIDGMGKSAKFIRK